MRTTLLLLLLSVLTCGGCIGWGYQHFKRDEVDQYDDMLAEFVKPYSGKTWFWVRGRASGNLDGDEADEEVIVASLHEGPKANNTPIQRLVLLITERDRKGNPQLLRRFIAFDAKTSLAQSPVPDGIHCKGADLPMIKTSAKVVDTAGDGRGLILLTLYSQQKENRVLSWHAGFQLPQGDESVRPVFQALTWQKDPLTTTLDLNKDGVDEILLDQAVLSSALTPDTPQNPAPLWRSVFVRTPEGRWVQNDGRHARAYALLLLPWYQAYVQSFHKGTAPERLAPFEYYLGRCHLMLGEKEPARSFLSRATQQGKGRIKQLAGDALSQCE